MKDEIDIYDCPRKPSLEYMIAVMQAAANGKPVQEAVQHGVWVDTPTPRWDWAYRYHRIDPASRPKIAEGHNPDQLTEDQVGVEYGWRLLTKAERKARVEAEVVRGNTGISMWYGSGWSDDDMHGNGELETYRTKKPAGYFLPPHRTAYQKFKDFIPNYERLTLVSEDGGKTWRLE